MVGGLTEVHNVPVYLVYRVHVPGVSMAAGQEAWGQRALWPGEPVSSVPVGGIGNPADYCGSAESRCADAGNNKTTFGHKEKAKITETVSLKKKKKKKETKLVELIHQQVI